MAKNISLNERADALERKMSDELDVLLSKSALFNMADGKLGASNAGSDLATRHGKYYLMADDPRLPKMPAKPTLADFFDYRAKGVYAREDDSRLPAARYLQRDFHQERPRLLGRAAGRALRRRGGELGDPRAPGAAIFP